MLLGLTDDLSTLVQVMIWRRQATSHYLSQCWSRSVSPYGVTRPQSSMMTKFTDVYIGYRPLMHSKLHRACRCFHCDKGGPWVGHWAHLIVVPHRVCNGLNYKFAIGVPFYANHTQKCNIKSLFGGCWFYPYLYIYIYIYIYMRRVGNVTICRLVGT